MDCYTISGGLAECLAPRSRFPSKAPSMIRLSLLILLVSAIRAQALSDEKTFDHSDWTRILKTRVSEEGWVDYEALRKKDGTALKAYLGRLGRARVEKLGSRDERMAFWINAYNALTIQKLIDAKLPAEVPHAAIFGKNIFEERTYRIAGKIRSLDDIEHGILRKDFKEPRVHAALVCGASSCPRLRREAYSGSQLDSQLTEETRRWIQSGLDLSGKRKNRLDRSRKIFYASKIFSWFEEDFGGSDAGVLKFLRKYASESDRAFLAKNRIRLRYLSYDWKLNRKKSEKK